MPVDGPPALSDADTERRRALGAFLWSDESRILAQIAHWREIGGCLECRISGGSMGTAVPGGSRLRIGVSADAAYPVGRVVAFLVGTRVIVHRIVYRGRRRHARGHVITLGDAVLVPDLPVPLDSILGPVLELEDKGRWRPPTPAPARSLGRRLAARMMITAAGLALELNVGLARRLLARCAALRDRWSR